MKLYFTLIMLAMFSFCQSQDQISVKDGNPKKDEAFSKTLNVLLASAGSNFESLPKHFKSRDIVDSTWTVDLILPGANESTISKSKGYISLLEHYTFSKGDWSILILLEKVKASLPDDYMYNLDYDAASGISDYKFTYDSKKATHPGYPEEFHLNGDLYSASISIMIL